MTIGPPFPGIQPDLQHSRSKVMVKGNPVSAASSWPIFLKFHLRTSHRLLSLSFHDIWASHSRDTIWSSKFKVKGHGQRYPTQRSVQLTNFLILSDQGILSTPDHSPSWYNLTWKFNSARKKAYISRAGGLCILTYCSLMKIFNPPGLQSSMVEVIINGHLGAYMFKYK